MNAHQAIRLEAELQRVHERRGMSLGARIDRAMRDALALAMSDAAPTGRESSRVRPGSSPPPPVNSLHVEYQRKLGLMVEALEREIDAEKYRPIGSGRETTGEREARLIRDFEGMPSMEVSFIDKTFGSPRSVERARAKHGRRPVDGLPNDKSWCKEEPTSY